MPDDAAFSGAMCILFANALDKTLDAKVLLIAGSNFAAAFIKQNEEADKFQQSTWAQQADEQAVLPGGQQLALGALLIK
ncbi:hypothetical protein, partial [Thiolapillus sp.]|uniref:hypothetical protein n=1 Tax=Thiolapillus sp. TaxID=2017437 RepID=UPI003AF5B331